HHPIEPGVRLAVITHQRMALNVSLVLGVELTEARRVAKAGAADCNPDLFLAGSFRGGLQTDMGVRGRLWFYRRAEFIRMQFQHGVAVIVGCAVRSQNQVEVELAGAFILELEMRSAPAAWQLQAADLLQRRPVENQKAGLPLVATIQVGSIDMDGHDFQTRTTGHMRGEIGRYRSDGLTILRVQ